MQIFDLVWVGLIVVLGVTTWHSRTTQSANYPWFSGLFWLAMSVMIVRTFFWEIYMTEGPSMSPTIPSHSVVMINKNAYGIVYPIWRVQQSEKSAVANEIIAFKHNDNIWIKRVRAKSGDVLVFDSNLGWFVNDTFVSPPTSASLSWMDHGGFSQSGVLRTNTITDISQQWNAYKQWRMVVPKGFVFVVGDNTEHSTDSRDIGFIPMRHVMGRLHWIKG